MMMIAMAVAALQGPWWCPMCSGYGMGGRSMMVMWLFWLVVLVALVWLAMRYAGTGRGGAGRSGDEAEAILRERYARGEIDETTYRRMLDELRRGR
jgi:putative membrane protein